MIRQGQGKSNSKSKKKPKWGKMAQQLRVTAVLPEDPGSVPRAHIGRLITNYIITPVPGLKHIPLASEGTHTGTHIHVHTQAHTHVNTHTHTGTHTHIGTHTH